MRAFSINLKKNIYTHLKNNNSLDKNIITSNHTYVLNPNYEKMNTNFRNKKP